MGSSGGGMQVRAFTGGGECNDTCGTRHQTARVPNPQINSIAQCNENKQKVTDMDGQLKKSQRHDDCYQRKKVEVK